MDLLDLLKIFVLLVVCVLAFDWIIAEVLRKTHYVYIDPSLPQEDYNFIYDVVKNSSWNNHFKIQLCDKKDRSMITTPHIWITIVEHNKIAPPGKKREYDANGEEIKFSVTVFSDVSRPVVWLNADNWYRGVPRSKLSISEYRKYVVEHELGHALGQDHVECNEYTAINGVCPVMYQSTRGCANYKCGIAPVYPVDLSKRIKAFDA
jgi:hypothetical protein